eukprot:TRINITY_DN81_c0_g1_i1.p1 TRINITY_DN81_c0_g1~~TRINITY_DN81_c0_g1_i1.p1  ORF type:complete len:579 (-),score=131.83 TRINITY_DN81_c0_g1_i1:13-1749(-)
MDKIKVKLEYNGKMKLVLKRPTNFGELKTLFAQKFDDTKGKEEELMVSYRDPDGDTIAVGDDSDMENAFMTVEGESQIKFVGALPQKKKKRKKKVKDSQVPVSQSEILKPSDDSLPPIENPKPVMESQIEFVHIDKEDAEEEKEDKKDAPEKLPMEEEETSLVQKGQNEELVIDQKKDEEKEIFMEEILKEPEMEDIPEPEEPKEENPIEPLQEEIKDVAMLPQEENNKVENEMIDDKELVVEGEIAEIQEPEKSEPKMEEEDDEAALLKAMGMGDNEDIKKSIPMKFQEIDQVESFYNQNQEKPKEKKNIQHEQKEEPKILQEKPYEKEEKKEIPKPAEQKPVDIQMPDHILRQEMFSLVKMQIQEKSYEKCRIFGSARKDLVATPSNILFPEFVLKNNSFENWDDNSILVKIRGNLEVEPLSMGQSLHSMKQRTLLIPINSPSKPGEYHAIMRFRDPKGNFFGDKLKIHLLVIPPKPEEVKRQPPQPVMNVKKVPPVPVPANIPKKNLNESDMLEKAKVLENLQYGNLQECLDALIATNGDQMEASDKLIKLKLSHFSQQQVYVNQFKIINRLTQI